MRKIFLFLFLLLIPTQLGSFFWPEWSLVNGIRSDYLSPTLYLVDLVWMGWILSEMYSYSVSQIVGLSERKRKKEIFDFLKTKKWILIMLTGVVVVVNILMAINWQVAIYRWIRIGQWMVTVWMLGRWRNEGAIRESPVQEILRTIIPIWMIVEGLLSVAQVGKNGSLQGIFYWIGERKFDYMTIGTALMSWGNEVFVRAYGSFSHPNSLAGFSLVAIMMMKTLSASPNSPSKGETKMVKRIIWWLGIFFGIVIVVLSGSRTVWALGVIILGGRFVNCPYGKIRDWQDEFWNKGGCKTRPYKALRFFVGLMLLMFVIWFSWGKVGGWDKDSWGKRKDLNKAAFEMIERNPLFGVGAGNFVVEIVNYEKTGILWLQPVHNVVLLGLSEIGVLGVTMVLIWLSRIKKIRKIKFEGWMMLGAILALGMMDHYWLTLSQNYWLMAIVVAII